MKRFDFPTEPLSDSVRRAREEGRKRVKIGRYTVHIYPGYALFEDPNEPISDTPSKAAKPNRQVRRA